MTFEELAARCESAAGPSYRLDTDIAEATNLFQNLPTTASVDDAIELVPRGWDWATGSGWRGGHAFMRRASAVGQEVGIAADAATPALALCAAALKARAASAIEAPSGVETGNTDSTEGESAASEAGDAR